MIFTFLGGGLSPKWGLLSPVSCSPALWVSAQSLTQGSARLTLMPPDSAPSAMCEMIKIMQEYGEVTCCLGSSANLRNSCLFLQSDIRSGGRLRVGACLGLGHIPWLVLVWLGPTDLGTVGREGVGACLVLWEMGCLQSVADGYAFPLC